MAQYSLSLSDGSRLTVGEHFQWQGVVYSLDKINQVNAKITRVSDGTHYNLKHVAISRSGVKVEGGTPFARVRTMSAPKPDAPSLRPGMVVTFDNEPGKLFVILKYQPQTDRYDIIALGGDSRNRAFAWRTPAAHLAPVDAINNMSGETASV